MGACACGTGNGRCPHSYHVLKNIRIQGDIAMTDGNSGVSKRVVMILFSCVGIIGIILLDTLLMGSTFSEAKAITGFANFNRYGVFLPLGIAVLVGHWYSPINSGVSPIRSPWNYILLGSVTGVMVLVHVIIFGGTYSQLASDPGCYAQLISSISVVLGLILGALCWPVHMRH